MESFGCGAGYADGLSFPCVGSSDLLVPYTNLQDPLNLRSMAALAAMSAW